MTRDPTPDTRHPGDVVQDWPNDKTPPELFRAAHWVRNDYISGPDYVAGQFNWKCALDCENAIAPCRGVPPREENQACVPFFLGCIILCGGGGVVFDQFGHPAGRFQR